MYRHCAQRLLLRCFLFLCPCIPTLKLADNETVVATSCAAYLPTILHPVCERFLFRTPKKEAKTYYEVFTDYIIYNVCSYDSPAQHSSLLVLPPFKVHTYLSLTRMMIIHNLIEFQTDGSCTVWTDACNSFTTCFVTHHHHIDDSHRLHAFITIILDDDDDVA